MMQYRKLHKGFVGYLWNALAALLILWGIFAILTPLTPGSWLIVVGLLMIFGRVKTQNITEKIIGKKLFNALSISKIIKKMPAFFCDR